MAQGVQASVPLAHSAPAEGRNPQPYADHVISARDGACARAEAMLRFATPKPVGFMEGIEAAGTFHDLGKLDPDNQAALAAGRNAPLPWDHIDAGVAYLMARKAHTAAWLVRAHHAPGVPSQPVHFSDNGRRLRGRRRNDDSMDRHDEQVTRTDAHLPALLGIHAAAAGSTTPARTKVVHGLDMRLALSCLVDADHTDTARFDTGFGPPKPLQPRWAERLASLDAYVAAFRAKRPGESAERNEHRRAFYETCRHSTIAAPLVACEGPVGIGKTTAVAAYLLKRAQEEGLRRLVIVAPYTNIITQTAGTLRRALTLLGEVPDEVVAEHHHRADFSSREARDLAVTWSAPVVVTTAVQFFETLAANDPSALRKLHALPGSAVFLDEAHAALPAHLWPQNWQWLRDLSCRWGCRFVFASGSLARFWENEDIIAKPQRLPELLNRDLRGSVLSAERQRIRYCQAGRFEGAEALMAAVADQPGPRLVILNTVQSAAVVARAMRDAGKDVLHISTALAPKDRAPVLAIVDERLKGKETDWTLVATSCVEAGVDLSFRTAFRERFSAASLIQTGGRVNRHGGPVAGAVIDFLLDAGGGITAHPAARNPAEVLKRFLKRGDFSSEDYDPALIVSRAMAEEIAVRGGLLDSALRRAEEERDYPKVAELGRVIDADTCVVVVDPDLAARIERRERVSFRALLSGSVQLWSPKIEQLRLAPLHGKSDVFRWHYEYDPMFLGIMEGMLRLSDLDRQGFMIL